MQWTGQEICDNIPRFGVLDRDQTYGDENGEDSRDGSRSLKQAGMIWRKICGARGLEGKIWCNGRGSRNLSENGKVEI